MILIDITLMGAMLSVKLKPDGHVKGLGQELAQRSAVMGLSLVMKTAMMD